MITQYVIPKMKDKGIKSISKIKTVYECISIVLFDILDVWKNTHQYDNTYSITIFNDSAYNVILGKYIVCKRSSKVRYRS